MASVKTILLPDGWVKLTGEPAFDVVMLGKPGRRQIQQQSSYAIKNFVASYKATELPDTIGAVYRFFHVIGAAYAFLVEDPLNFNVSALGCNGVVKLVGSDYRLMQEMPITGETSYFHPITRPQADTVVLAGGASGGTLDYDTGIVTGISAEGLWTGEFYVPMVMMGAKLSYSQEPGAAVEVVNVTLEEQIEIAFS